MPAERAWWCPQCGVRSSGVRGSAGAAAGFGTGDASSDASTCAVLSTQVVPEAPGQDVVHGGGVIGCRGPGDGELPVVGFLRQAVLHHHHRGHHVGPLDVGDVIAFDAQQRDRQLQGLLKFLQRLGPDSEVPRAACLVQPEGVFGVLPDRGHQGGFVASLRNPDIDLCAPEAAQPHGQVLRRCWAPPAPAPRGEAAPGFAVLAVDLLEQVLHQVRGGGVLHLFDHPAALASDPAAADMEHLDRRFEFVLVQREDVGVRVLRQHHGVPLEDLAEGRDIVAEPGGPFVVQFRYGGRHFLFQPADKPLGLAAHEGAEVFGQAPVFLGGDAADAGGRALVDVAQQARPAAGLGALEHAGAAAAHRERPAAGCPWFPGWRRPCRGRSSACPSAALRA